jgi:hypothetical protein
MGGSDGWSGKLVCENKLVEIRPKENKNVTNTRAIKPSLLPYPGLIRHY